MRTQFLCAVAIASFAWAPGALAGGPATKPDGEPTVVYVAHLHPLNTKVTGVETTGEVRLSITGDTLTISASPEGSYQYQKTVSLKDLETAFAKAFGDKELDLDRRVVFIHGILPSTKLPASAASLGTIPAQVTLPIACGEIKRVQQ
jgi:hypothetical protein